MVGIVSYGGYIPKLRLNRKSILNNMGWFAPSIAGAATGERSFCNWDEDSLTMAVAACKDCLVGKDKSTIDAVYLCSTTLPFSDRLNAGILKTALNLRDDLYASDFTSSLRAGTSALINALSVARSGDKRQILIAATDSRLARSASPYEMWFGDGAASLLVGDTDVIAEFLGSYSLTYDFVDHYRGSVDKYDYVWEERWIRDEGFAKIIPEAITGLLNKLSISIDDVDRLVFPCYFRGEHKKIARKLNAKPEILADNMHDVCGDTGTAHPLVLLVNALQEARPGDLIVVAGFGQGSDALCFKVTEAVRDLSPRAGIKGALERKKSTDNYMKFLKFRDVLEAEMGIRAEAPTQTAMTVLWRKRDMILGLVGGKCTKCGTPQFPRMNICVNPKCKAVNTQEPYEFADKPCYVKSFTGDYLAVSVDPPAIYGMIEFAQGGRFMADFTDCELSEVHVGQQVTMSFRRRYVDKERGFTGYFWKAVPVTETKYKEAL